MDKAVLITGAYGFIGRHVARELASQGWLTTCIGHSPPDESLVAGTKPASWQAAEIALDTLVRYAGRPDVIVHCAGSGSVGYSTQDPLGDFERNVGTLAAVLEFVRKHAPRARVVYPSSTAVYGMAAQQPLVESTPLNPVSPYGAHKTIAEQLCQSYSTNFGVAVAVVRLFSVYGPGLKKQLLWDACEKISRGETVFFGDGSETRDWVHVADAVRLLMLAADHASSECPIVNGGTGIATENCALLGKLLECFGREDKPLFTGNQRPGDPKYYQADNRRAQSWGWVPTVQWPHGVAEYVDWYRKEIR